MNALRDADASPLLTIAIPTYNRAAYLRESLRQLAQEVKAVAPGVVEILVSDNCSPDQTPVIVEEARASGLTIHYIRNASNLGWALNFIQCYEQAGGRHVLLMGDDDLLVDGSLALLLERLTTRAYGVICMRPYGFNDDFRQEIPSRGGREYSFTDGNQFLLAINRCFTLTSALVLNKSLLTAMKVDSRQFLTTDLATFHLVLRAALGAKENLFINRYMVASKRQNSSSYDYAKVFVEQLWMIVDSHEVHGLQRTTIRRLERNKLFTYYPFYLFDLRLSGRGDAAASLEMFKGRFGDRLLFRYWLAPILRWPRPLAIAWGGMATAIGRVLNGDLKRGLAFALNRIRRR